MCVRWRGVLWNSRNVSNINFRKTITGDTGKSVLLYSGAPIFSSFSLSLYLYISTMLGNGKFFPITHAKLYDTDVFKATVSQKLVCLLTSRNLCTNETKLLKKGQHDAIFFFMQAFFRLTIKP